MNPADLLALARIARAAGPNTFRYTARGDGLRAIGPAPFEAWLYRSPAGTTDPLAPATRGLDPGGHLQPVHVTALEYPRSAAGSGGVELWQAPYVPLPDAEAVLGAWLCLPRAALKPPEDGSFYRFELLGLPVHCGSQQAWGSVTDFFETGAHGILEVKASDGTEVLVPLVDAYFLDFDREAGVIRAQNLDELREAASS